MTTFEYRIVTYALGWKGFDYASIEGQLTKLGAEGWEAVNALQPSIGSAPTDIVILLKRAR